MDWGECEKGYMENMGKIKGRWMATAKWIKVGKGPERIL